jgi:hypothetical protein
LHDTAESVMPRWKNKLAISFIPPVDVWLAPRFI